MRIRIGPTTWGNWICGTIVRNADALALVSCLNNIRYSRQIKLFVDWGSRSGPGQAGKGVSRKLPPAQRRI